jgi:hypothetical protein
MARSVLNRKRRDKLEEKEGEIGKIRYSWGRQEERNEKDNERKREENEVK